MIEVGIEMHYFRIDKVQYGVVSGSFMLRRLKKMEILFEYKDHAIEFSFPYSNIEEYKKLVEKWVTKEKEMYEDFIFNLFNEIDKLNDIPVFSGKCISNSKLGKDGEESYYIDIQYDQLPCKASFGFYPYTNQTFLTFIYFFPLDSKGNMSNLSVDGLLKKETIQRMWKPFQNETPYGMEIIKIKEEKAEIEMEVLNLFSSNDSKAQGFFTLKNFENLCVEFMFENGLFTFSLHQEIEENQKLFSIWNENEKECYTTFLLDYFSEIKKIDDIPSFSGKLVKEYYFTSNPHKFVFILRYDQLPNEVHLAYYPENGDIDLYTETLIPINSKGKYGKTAINDVLNKETIKRMWEPFRDQSKHRLKLLHFLK